GSDGGGRGCVLFFFSSRRRHTSFSRDWSSDVCSSDLGSSSALSYSVAASDRALWSKSAGVSESDEDGRRRHGGRVGVLLRSPARSEERRAGKERRARGAPHHQRREKSRA